MHVGDFAARRARQKRAVIILSTVLITGGIVILFLKRVPVPARIMAGLGDVVAGCVLLLAWRQKFGGK